MGHGITRTDSVLLVKDAAWHGLGQIVPEGITPSEAIKRASMDWEIQPWDLVAIGPGGIKVKVDTHVMNMRSDLAAAGDYDNAQIGVVGVGYEAVQNMRMAEFAEALADQGDIVKIETVGSIHGGKKVWILLKGDSFSIRGKDAMHPYIALNNSHNGTTTLRCDMTSVREVCANTMAMIVPVKDTMEGSGQYSLTKTGIKIRHSGDVMEKLEAAREALGLYQYAVKGTRESAEFLAGKQVPSEDKLREYFFKTYEQTIQEIPYKPENASQQRRLDKALSAFHSFHRRFDDENKLTGSSYWGAFNAFSGAIQHDMKARGSDDVTRVERRVSSNLFGLNSERTLKAYELALSLAS